MKNIPKKQFAGWMLMLLLCISISAFAQSPKKVTGRVMDAQGELLIGVNVTEAADPSNGVVTDINGTYTITLKGNKPSLKFSYIGFKDKVVAVGSKGVLDVALEEDVAALDEVVVVGFGTQKKASVVGSITNIEPAKLAAPPSRSLSNNLAGMVPGVIAVQRSGDPWFNNSDFWIRGISSFTGNTNPLVLVDGVERSLHDIDPEEIASFSVLKDAAASAVYGVRGANGVVMIETKRGKIGKPQVNVRFEHSFTQPIKIPDYIGSVKYLELINEMYAEQGRAPFASEATLLNYKNQTDPELYPDVNWWDIISKDHADNTKANVSVNGGTDILRYALVAGYYNENGIIERDKNQEWDSSLKVSRYTVRSNVDVNVTPTTLFRANVGVFLQTRNAPPGDTETNQGIFYQAMRVPPYVHPAIYADGRIPRVMYKQNPWAWATQRGYEKLNHNKIESLVSLEQDLKFITPGLKFKGTFSFDKFSATSVTRSKNPYYYNPATARDAEGNIITDVQTTGQEFLGYEKGAKWGDQSIYLEGMFSYNRIFGKVHDVNAMFLYNQKEYDNGDALPYRTQGIAGRFSYTYDSRYVAELNFGYNGSENFAKGKRFGFFPSVAAGWVVSNEPFWRAIKDKVNLLKFRVSYGLVGNDVISSEYADRFPYLTTVDMDQGYDVYIGTNHIRKYGPILSVYGNPDATWEESRKLDVGVEIGLFDSLNIIFDWFKEKRSGIFMQRASLPSSFGMSNITPWANIGKVDNRGVDISVDYNKAFSKDLILSLRGSFTYAHNEVVEMDEPAYKWDYLSKVGHPINSINCLIAEGLFQDEEEIASSPSQAAYATEFPLRPGDIKFKDLNGDRVIDDNDKCWYGNPTVPEIIYGFGFSLKYKGFDCSAFFQGQGKVSIIMYDSHPFGTKATPGGGLMQWMADEHWREEAPDPNARYPRLSPEWNTNNTQANSLYVRNGRMLRLKNAEIGYTYKFMRVYVSGTNLLTFSPFKYWDPEKGSGNGLSYPLQRTCNLGFQFTF